jgi:hypothetical protein
VAAQNAKAPVTKRKINLTKKVYSYSLRFIIFI